MGFTCTLTYSTSDEHGLFVSGEWRDMLREVGTLFSFSEDFRLFFGEKLCGKVEALFLFFVLNENGILERDGLLDLNVFKSFEEDFSGFLL